MMNRLPFDMQLRILQALPVFDIFAVRSTCRALYRVTEIRAVWHHAMTERLHVVPMSSLYRDRLSMSTEELRRCAVKAARLDEKWHTPGLVSRVFSNMEASPNIRYAKLLPGGDWVVTVLSDGTAMLQKLTESGPSVVAYGAGAELQQLSCELSFSSDYESLLLITGEDQNSHTSRLFLYHVKTTVPAMESLDVLSLETKILAASASFDLLVFATDSEYEERELIYVRGIELDGEEVTKQVILDLTLITNIQDSTIRILSPTQLLISSGYGFSQYNIPDFPSTQEDAERGIISVRPCWVLEYHLVVYPPVMSPTIWDRTTRCQLRPIFILDYHAAHIIDPSSVPPSHREFPLPVRDDGELEIIGFRRGLWWRDGDVTLTPDDTKTLNISTCTFPEIPQGCNIEEVPMEELSVGVGSLLVACHDQEVVDYLSFDEWSGRVCLILREPGGKRVTVVDSV